MMKSLVFNFKLLKLTINSLLIINYSIIYYLLLFMNLMKYKVEIPLTLNTQYYFYYLMNKFSSLT